MGCTARGGDSIQIKKRLLAIAVVGAVLVISAVMVASLKGNDKPEITNNPPTDNEQPASTPQPAVYYTDSPDDYWTKEPHPQGPQMKPADSSSDTDEDDDDTDDGNGNGNGNGNGQSDADKKHGLERAIEVHLRNMEKKDAKGGESSSSHDGKGLENSLAHLQDNLEKHNSADDASSADANSHNT